MRSLAQKYRSTVSLQQKYGCADHCNKITDQLFTTKKVRISFSRQQKNVSAVSYYISVAQINTCKKRTDQLSLATEVLISYLCKQSTDQQSTA
jgi:hypothetical protein